jgi:hypothetical protein
MRQTTETISQILQLFFRHYSDVIDSPDNRDLLAEDIASQFGGVYTVANLQRVADSNPLLRFKPSPTSTKSPKNHAAIYAPPEKSREIMAAVKAETPLLIISEKNTEKIFHWLWENDAVGGFTLENVRCAVAVLGNALDRVPPPPPPPPPKREPEKLETWQLPLTATKQQLHNADPKALKDYLARARAQ